MRSPVWCWCGGNQCGVMYGGGGLSAMNLQPKRITALQSNYLHVPGDPNKPLVYMIPGNPGLCEFYRSFAEELALRLKGYEILVCSLRGFDIKDSAGQFSFVPKTHSLDDQVDHVLNVVNLVALSGSQREPTREPRKVIILGHSVGSWLAKRVVSRQAELLNANVVFVGLVAPTIIDISQSERGLKVARLMALEVWCTVVALVSKVLYTFLPATVLLWLVHYFTNLTGYNLEISTRLVSSPNVIQQALNMGREEMVRIGTDLEPPDIAGFWSNTTLPVWALFMDRDHWVSPETREKLLEKVSDKPNMRFEICENPKIPHSFCLHYSLSVAEIVCMRVGELIDA